MFTYHKTEMSGFFYEIVNIAVNYDDTDAKAELFSLKLTDMRQWCEEQLDLDRIPKGRFRDCVMKDLFDDNSAYPYHYKLWKYIQETCWPENPKVN
jgi:hypothetical protein